MAKIKRPGISFWDNMSNNLTSHGAGLSENEIEFLHSLVPGDRLIIYHNKAEDKLSDNSPDYTLRKFVSNKKKAAEQTEETPPEEKSADFDDDIPF